eukprot:gene8741-3756_t
MVRLTVELLAKCPGYINPLKGGRPPTHGVRDARVRSTVAVERPRSVPITLRRPTVPPPPKEREIDLRGHKIPEIENLGHGDGQPLHWARGTK